MNFDVVVIGAGPAGEVLAGRCADGGLSVALVERELVGGECSHWGCVPSKTLIRPGDALAAARRVAGAEVFVPDALCGQRRARRIRNGAAEHCCQASTLIAVVRRSCTLDWVSPLFTQASSRSLALTVRSAPADARARGREKLADVTSRRPSRPNAKIIRAAT